MTLSRALKTPIKNEFSRANDTLDAPMRTVKPLLLKSDAGDVYDILITTLENTTAEVKFPLISLVE